MYRSVDLPAAAFPFTVELLDAETRDVLWQVAVTDPGALRVPGKAELGGRATTVRIKYADGTEAEA